ncbi:DUF3014 domain-containing protein [Hydrogenophaga sp. 5NK40-0174]|uniref:DUF3014 domain-containing protein n=1 Tax=Hydrogenophaga sp. 5NK40-0174 TaxID=3127649 RepID=UPI003108D4FA
MREESSGLSTVVIAVAVLAGVGLLAWAYFAKTDPGLLASPESQVTIPAPPEPAPADPAPAGLAPETEDPAIANPIEPLEPEEGEEEVIEEPLPALQDSDARVKQVIGTMLSKRDMLTFLQLDGFVRKVVATVDNMGRKHAPPTVWPVIPTPKKFMTAKGDDGTEVIAPANSDRYTPFVGVVESVDTAQAAAAYRSLYPLFQQAYEDLGYPGKYFNDRLVTVLDQMIATPIPSEPLQVSLVEVKGSVPSLRPWVRYEFVDPAYADLSAGQKMLLRSGADNQKRLQAKLKAFRQLVARPR